MGILHGVMGILHGVMGILLANFDLSYQQFFHELSTITGTDTMHAENLYAENLSRYRNMKLFSEGGISPTGDCWVSLTAIFLQLWNSPTGVHLKKQGFRLQNNGKQVGASQDCILVCPRKQ
ncbi:hypothetical protein C6499_12755 [Candidatus Poribacteria bacterium]|nr:MAG: hypothetical protein C6499_12755 [Candidatus Poribacteria bacterium]